MARNRVIYQSASAYAGPSPATGIQYILAGTGAGTSLISPLVRIQSASYGYNVAHRDVNQFGELAAIDRVILDSPTVNFSFEYLNQSFYNEVCLGFLVTSGNSAGTSCIANILNKTQDERNYWLETVAEGVDAVANTDQTLGLTGPSALGIGNGFISNYSHQGTVGDFPKTQIQVEALNLNVANNLGTGVFTQAFAPTGYNTYPTPAVLATDGSILTGWAVLPVVSSNPTGAVVGNFAVSVLRPGDITFDFKENGTSTDITDGGLDVNDLKIQSYSISIPLNRQPLLKLGSKFAFSREIQFPVTVQVQIQAAAGSAITGNLANYVTADKNFDIAVKLKNPTSTSLQMRYDVKRAKLDSVSFSDSIGPSRTVTYNFSTQIGGPLQTGVGVFFSGLMQQ